MKELRQKYFLSAKSFELHDTKIRIQEKSLFKEIDWEVKYSELGLDLVRYRDKEGVGNVMLFGGMFFLSAILSATACFDGSSVKVAFLLAFVSIFFAMLLLWTFQTYFTSSFVLRGGSKTIEFFIDSPSEGIVKEFIETIKDRIKQKAKDSMAVFDPDLTFEDQLANLKYLKNIEILTEMELERIKKHLKYQHLVKNAFN